MARKLTNKQRMFCEYYIQHWNATLAAKQAGYKGSNETLRAVGYENLTKPHIKAYIEKRFSEVVMTSDEVLSRLGSMARSFDMIKYIKLKEQNKVVTKMVQGKPKHYKEFTGYAMSFDHEQLQADGFSHLVKKIKQNNRGGIEIEWHDQMKALELIGKHLKLFTEKLLLEGSLDFTGMSDDGTVAAAAAIIARRKKNITEGN